MLAAFLTVPAPTRAEEPGEELARLAAALHKGNSNQSYRQLARFAERYSDSELSAQATFALGFSDFEQQRWGQARARFRAARSSRQLGDYAVFYQAQAEAQLGLLETALATLKSGSFTGSALDEPAAALAADWLAQLHRPGDAVRALQARPDIQSRPGLLLALGQAQWAAGQGVAAAATLQRVYYEFPLSLQAEPANQILSQVRAEMKGDYPAPSEALRQTRADKLWELRAYRGARSAYLDVASNGSNSARQRGELRAAEALYLTGSTGPACNELVKSVDVGPPLQPELHFFRARCALLRQDNGTVEAELRLLGSQWPASDAYRSALLVAGNTALVQGNVADAKDYYRRLVAAFTDGDEVVEAHWRLAWLTYREGDRAGAARLMQEHLTRFPDSRYRARALYWRARLALSNGERALAGHLLSLLRDWAPRDYLSQQAAPIVASLDGGPAGDDDPLPDWALQLPDPRERPPAAPLPPDAQAQLDKAAALERLSLWDLAEQELSALVEKLPNLEVYLAQARAARAQEKYAVATETLNRAFPGYWRYRLDDLPRSAWEIMFPRPYWSLIEREAHRRGLDPYLVAALIRQESRFERNARSSAGALGLMQLMPATARHLARRRLPESRLHDPELNIQLGTAFLAGLLDRFNGSVEKAVAAYNAGGTRVEGWASGGSFDGAADFVESIPVTQTREFVYTVLRNYRFYRDLYADR